MATLTHHLLNGESPIGMGCDAESPCDKTLKVKIEAGEWQEYRLSLSCFADLGVDMSKISSALMITAEEGTDIGLGIVRLEPDIDAKPGCDGK